MSAEDTNKPVTKLQQTGTERPVTRELLYELVWSEPMLKVAARYGVSSSYMARVCTQLYVPRPERGYWAKLAVGKAPKQPALPEPRPGDQLEWSRDAAPPRRARLLPKPPQSKQRSSRAATSARTDLHPLIKGAKPLFEAGRLAYEGGYLRPAKKLLVDLAVTKSGLDRALSFSNKLFHTFESHGYRVLIAPNSQQFYRAEIDEREDPGKSPYHNNLWGPLRCTVVYIGRVAIGLTVIEMSEVAEARPVNGEYVRVADHVPQRRGRHTVDYGWTSKQYFPTSRLCLQAYSPYPRARWKQQWRESKNQDISNSIPAIVRELEKAAPLVAKLVEEGEQQAELERQQWAAQQEQWRREEEDLRAAKALKASKEELLDIIEGWAAAKRLDEFFAAAEHRVGGLPEEQRRRVSERLRRAREMIGSTDALDQFRCWRTPEER
jgi:hypothetical protein